MIEMSWATILKANIQYIDKVETFKSRIMSSKPDLHPDKLEALALLYEMGKLAEVLPFLRDVNKPQLIQAGKVFEEELIQMLEKEGIE